MYCIVFVAINFITGSEQFAPGTLDRPPTSEKTTHIDDHWELIILKSFQIKAFKTIKLGQDAFEPAAVHSLPPLNACHC